MNEHDDKIIDHLRRRAEAARPRVALEDVKAGRRAAERGDRKASRATNRRRVARFVAAAGVVAVGGFVAAALWPDDRSDTSIAPVEPSESTTSTSAPAGTTIAPIGMPVVVERGDLPRDVSPFMATAPDVQWERRVVSDSAARARTSAIAAATDDLIVAGTGEGEVVGLDPETGDMRWTLDLTTGTVALEDYNRYAMYPAIDGDSVFVAASTGLVHAVDAGTGELRWSTEVGGLFGGFPVVVDGVVVVARSWGDIYDDRVDYAGGGRVADGGVVGLATETGAVVWERDFDEGAYVGPGPDGTVVVASFDSQFIGNGALELVDAATGDGVWRVEGLDVDAPPTYGNGVVVAGARDLIAFDVAGNELWRTSPDWCRCTFQFPLIIDDIVAVVTNEGGVYGLDLRTGATCWGYSIGDNYAITYPGPPGIVGFAAGPGGMWIDARSGEPLAYGPQASAPLSISPTSSGDVVASLDGTVRLVGPIAPAADTPDVECPSILWTPSEQGTSTQPPTPPVDAAAIDTSTFVPSGQTPWGASLRCPADDFTRSATSDTFQDPSEPTSIDTAAILRTVREYIAAESDPAAPVRTAELYIVDPTAIPVLVAAPWQPGAHESLGAWFEVEHYNNEDWIVVRDEACGSFVETPGS